MRTVCRREWLCLAIALGACKGKRDPAPPTPASDASTAITSAIGKSDSAPARASGETEIHAFLSEWVAAQNNGDIASYRATYATEFQGVDQTRKRARMVKAAAWMKKQQRLFVKPQTVTTRDEKAEATGDHGTIRFLRTVDSGTYHEESERLLVLRRAAGVWQITREEVRSSKVDPSRGSAMDEMAYALIWEGDVVLADDVGDAWVVGRPRLRESESSVAVAKVDEQALPASVLRWKRERLRLIDGELDECMATVTGFEVIAHSEWDMGTIRAETGDDDRKTAAKVWEAKHLLVARLGEEEGQCTRPLLARPARLPRGEVFAFEQPSDELASVAIDLFDKLPEVAKLTAQVKAESPEWDQPPTTTLAKAGKAGFFMSVRNLGPAGCGEPGFYADAIWRSPDARDQEKWELVRSPDEGKALLHVLLFDDGTGKPRVVYRGDMRMGVLQWDEGKLTVDQDLEIPYLDCRC